MRRHPPPPYSLFYYNPERVVYRRHYGVFSFLGDLLMTALTSGLWLIWIFIREMRNR